MSFSLSVSPLKGIQMGDSVVVHLKDTGNHTITGVIRSYDYGNGNLLIETTSPDTLQVVSNYAYLTKVLT